MDRRKFLVTTGAVAAASALPDSTARSSGSKGDVFVDKTLNTLPKIIIHEFAPVKPNKLLDYPGPTLDEAATIGWTAFAGGHKYGSFQYVASNPDDMPAAELIALANEVLVDAENSLKRLWTGVPVSHEEGVARDLAHTAALYEKPHRSVDVGNGYQQHALTPRNYALNGYSHHVTGEGA